MKRLVQLDPDTLKPESVICTFELIEDEDRVEVTFADPKSKLHRRAILETVAGGKRLTPNDGAAYYDAIDRTLRGTFRYIEIVPAGTEDPTVLPSDWV